MMFFSSKVCQLAVAANEWSRAFLLVKEHPECKRDVYLPYAYRMAQENKFVEAQKGKCRCCSGVGVRERDLSLMYLFLIWIFIIQLFSNSEGNSEGWFIQYY